jgi:hypothetical protein
VIQRVAPTLKIDVIPADMRDAADIERAVTAFAGPPNSGMIVLSAASGVVAVAGEQGGN